LPQPRFPKPNGRASECACERVLSVPLFPSMTAEQVNYVAASVLEVVEKNNNASGSQWLANASPASRGAQRAASDRARVLLESG